MFSLKSKITREILNFFFINPAESLYINELCRKLNLDKRNLVKKIRELEKEGILTSQARGNLKLYSINRSYPLYKEYKSILLKSFGFENKLKQITQEIDGIKRAYIYGSYAREKMGGHSDIDLLIVGNHNILLLQRKLNNLQRTIDREINTVNMDDRDFNRRVKNKDAFISEILKRKHIQLI